LRSSYRIDTAMLIQLVICALGGDATSRRDHALLLGYITPLTLTPVSRPLLPPLNHPPWPLCRRPRACRMFMTGRWLLSQSAAVCPARWEEIHWKTSVRLCHYVLPNRRSTLYIHCGPKSTAFTSL